MSMDAVRARTATRPSPGSVRAEPGTSRRARFRRARMRRALALAGCGVLAVALPACESTEQESARITRESEAAHRAEAAKEAAHKRAVARSHGHGKGHGASSGKGHGSSSATKGSSR